MVLLTQQAKFFIMGSIVQFVGKDDLLKAYNNRGIDVWALCQGKEIICTGAGADELTEFVTMLEKQPGNAGYSLRLYSEVENPDRITNKTEWNNSFKFMLDAPAGQVGAFNRAGQMGTTDIIAKKISDRIGAVVDKELDKMFSGNSEEKEEKEGGLMGFIQPYIDTPDKLIATIGAIKNMFAPAGAQVSPVTMAAIGNVQPQRAGTADAGALVDTLSPEMLERLGAALDRLGRCDKDIVVHLEQLADIAEKKPDTYKMAINFLK